MKKRLIVPFESIVVIGSLLFLFIINYHLGSCVIAVRIKTPKFICIPMQIHQAQVESWVLLSFLKPSLVNRP